MMINQVEPNYNFLYILPIELKYQIIKNAYNSTEENILNFYLVCKNTQVFVENFFQNLLNYDIQASRYKNISNDIGTLIKLKKFPKNYYIYFNSKDKKWMKIKSKIGKSKDKKFNRIRKDKTSMCRAFKVMIEKNPFTDTPYICEIIFTNTLINKSDFVLKALNKHINAHIKAQKRIEASRIRALEKNGLFHL